MGLLQLKDVRKMFEATRALNGAALEVAKGEVHALLGENGAGKSTFMKIIAGVIQADSGTFLWKGKAVRFLSPLDAMEAGICMIHQELSLVPGMSVSENIFLARWPRKYRFWLDRSRLEERAGESLRSVGLKCTPHESVEKLRPAEMQMVEIARALSLKSELIIMDEPTSSLSAPEIERLFDLIEDLSRQGVAIVYISHQLEEVERISHRVTVLRDGRRVASSPTKGLTHDEMIRLMSGRRVVNTLSRDRVGPHQGKELFRAENFSAGSLIEGINLEVRAGEIVGIAGLVGAGRTFLAEAIFGIHQRRGGQLYLNGRPVELDSPERAVALGLGYLTEDRRKTGLILGAPILENIVLSAQRKHSRFSFFNRTREREEVSRLIELLSIRSSGPQTPVFQLSGGNQQKVALARWLYSEARFLILDEPTRGIDVASRRQIYDLIRRLTQTGVGVLLISSDTQELLGICHRVLVMREGKVVGEVIPDETTDEEVLKLAVGGSVEG